MQWFKRLLMDPYQRRLTDPQAFTQPLDRDQLLAEVRANKLGCHETQSFVEGTITDTNPGGPLTIAAVVDDYRRLKDALEVENDRGLREFGVVASAGHGIALEYLIRRANHEPEWPAVGRPRRSREKA